MSEARQRERWDHTSFIIATLMNANRDPKKRRRPFAPSEFNPFSPDSVRGSSSDGIQITPKTIHFLKVFVK